MRISQGKCKCLELRRESGIMSFFKAHLGVLTARKSALQNFENSVLSDGGTYDKALFLSEYAALPALARSSGSMALVAGAYKAGRIYAIHPILGTRTDIPFVRAGVATYFDKNGILQSAAANIPRIDYDPVTKAVRGYLFEGSATNVIPYSNDFLGSGWSKVQSTVEASSIVDPTGGTSAQKLKEDTSLNYHGVQASGATSALTMSASIFAKAGERRYITLVMSGNTIRQTVTFDLLTGAITSETQVNITKLSASVIQCANGWWRIMISGTSAGFGILTIRTSLTGINTDVNGEMYQGDGTSGVYIWGAQMTASNVNTSYIATAGAQVTRAADLTATISNIPWFNNNEGSLYADFSHQLVLDNTIGQYQGANNIINLRKGGTNALAGFTEGSVVRTLYVTTGTGGERNKLASSYKLNELAFVYNGSAPATGSVFIPGLITFVVIFSPNVVECRLRSHVYFPIKLTTNQLQTLTTL